MTFSYSFRQHDENHFIFVDVFVLVLVLVHEKTLLITHILPTSGCSFDWPWLLKLPFAGVCLNFHAGNENLRWWNKLSGDDSQFWSLSSFAAAFMSTDSRPNGANSTFDTPCILSVHCHNGLRDSVIRTELKSDRCNYKRIVNDEQRTKAAEL